jgi:anti-sigma regulatory factor (Ser/Thr protein kinase)
MNYSGKSFVYKHDTAALPSMVRGCLGYVEAQTSLSMLPAEFFQKVQWAITELLLNGVKHSGLRESTIHLEFNETGLTVLREDKGKPLSLKVIGEPGELTWPLSDDLMDRQFEIYRNGVDALKIYTESNVKVHFLVTEVVSEEMPVLLENTSEHFGLMIIAKASDRFHYRCDQGKNFFATTFNY